MKQCCTGYAGFLFARPTEEPHPSVQFSFLRSLFITTHSFPVEAPESQLISWVTLQIDNDKGCDGFIVYTYTETPGGWYFDYSRRPAPMV